MLKGKCNTYPVQQVAVMIWLMKAETYYFEILANTDISKRNENIYEL